MPNRIELHNELTAILGTENVYFQPPESLKLKYPCIIYAKDGTNGNFADDKIYASHNRYTITVIDKDPDSSIADKLLGHFSMCSYNRRFSSDNLNHCVLSLYY